jgi:transcriptional regulator with XRE-family HTH domain
VIKYNVNEEFVRASQRVNDINKLIGFFLKDIRKSNNLTGEEIAKKLDISQQQWSRYERGVNKLSLDKLLVILLILDVSPHEVLDYLFDYIATEVKKENALDAMIFT